MYSHSPTVFRTYRFDAFEVDTRSGELHQDGARVPLQDVPFRLLAALLNRPGDVCSRDELRNEIWPAEVHLDFEGALATAARKVRQALSDDFHVPRFIETLPGRGFRFIGEVIVVPEETGLPQTAQAAPSARRRLPGWTTVALLAGLAMTVLVVWSFRGRTAGAAKLAPIRSIAVLPLENLSDNPEQEYFADGMTDAITTELGKISGFDRVIAWQSMKGYKKTTQPLTAIARELSVDALVQGTVQREGPQVRISTKLFLAKQEKQIWAWAYDRDMREILSLQSEVAQAIAREVQGSITNLGTPSSADPASVNPEAYDLYLRGKSYFEFGGDKASIFNSIHMYDQAIALDPKFFQPYPALSAAHLAMYFGRDDRTEARRGAAMDAAQKGLRLQPNSAEAHWALGRLYHQGYLDYPRALEEFETAQRINPNNADVQAGIGAVKRRQGKVLESIPFFERAAALDPNDDAKSFHLGVTYSLVRRYEDGDRMMQRALSRTPNGFRFARRVWFSLLAGRVEVARATLAEARDKHQKDPRLSYYQYQLDMWSGDSAKALSGLSSEPEEMIVFVFRIVPKTLLQAHALSLAGKVEPARRQYDLTRQMLEEKIRTQAPEDHDLFYGPLGIAYAGLGLKREAVEAGKKAIALCPASREAWRSASCHEEMAQIDVMVGEPGEALKELDYLLSIPSEISTYALMNDPTWAPLKTSKGFQDLVRKYGH